MNRRSFPQRILFLTLLFSLAAGPVGLTQNGFRVLTGSGLKYAIPHEFYLEGNAVPVDSRNAVLIETSSGARVLVALVVTSGWASQFPHKYSGILISEGALSLCGNPLTVGSYGFGLHQPAAPSDRDAEFVLYNQAGEKVWECMSRKDLDLKGPRPLQVIPETLHSARIYFGRYSVEIQPKGTMKDGSFVCAG